MVTVFDRFDQLSPLGDTPQPFMAIETRLGLSS
jgi:hypothetical protein